MPAGHLESPFLQYLIHHDLGVGERLPTLQEVSGELGVSVGKLREQLEVARGLGGRGGLAFYPPSSPSPPTTPRPPSRRSGVFVFAPRDSVMLRGC